MCSQICIVIVSKGASSFHENKIAISQINNRCLQCSEIKLIIFRNETNSISELNRSELNIKTIFATKNIWKKEAFKKINNTKYIRIIYLQTHSREPTLTYYQVIQYYYQIFKTQFLSFWLNKYDFHSWKSHGRDVSFAVSNYRQHRKDGRSLNHLVPVTTLWQHFLRSSIIGRVFQSLQNVLPHWLQYWHDGSQKWSFWWICVPALSHQSPTFLWESW